ncbi:MAG: sensor histidine kinase [Rubrivivax sp.]|nr:sensor histidine kinase [Rubrivivax sp.]
MNDLAVMAVGIPGFGLAIPWLTGLYGPHTPRERLYWVGAALFVGLAAAIWLGNRWLLFRQREHLDWFSHPLRKLSMLVAANVLYTVPVTVGGLLAWFALAGLPVDTQALQLVVMTNVVCVLFVTHAYETMFLIRERESDFVRVERLERLRAQAELAALEAQVDPHFLFNSLNTLGHLVTQDAQRAREFCDTLAEVYRYVLDIRRRDLVPLAEELAFLRRYHRLLELRFGPAVLPLVGADEVQAGAARWQVVPMALQGLLENAVKHNRASAAEPLPLTLALGEGLLNVANPRRSRRSALPSAGVGLANLAERCRLLTGRPLERVERDGHFEVRVPLLPIDSRSPP